MSLNLVDAFNTIIGLQGRVMQIERYGSEAAMDIVAAPTNYNRKLSAIEESVVTGREFIISIQSLTGTAYNPPKRGDIIIDTALGENTIDRVEEMIILGNITGYRVRTS